MSEPNTISSTLLDGYLAGTATSDEVAQVQVWMHANPDHRDLVAMLASADAVADASPQAPVANWGQIDTDQAKRALFTMIGASEVTTLPMTLDQKPRDTRGLPSDRSLPATSGATRSTPRWSFRQFFNAAAASPPRVAATLLLLAVATVGGVGGLVLGRSHGSPTSNAMMTYSTGNAQHATIQFADGSRVILNVASRIQVPENFSQGNRVIHLTGEAYFDVAHADRSPFVVHAQGAKVRVLGTQFGVRAYQESPLQVAVQSGRVAMNDSVLNARDIASARTDGTVSIHRNQSVDAMLSFTTARLVLNGVMLRDAIADLNRWYDVDVRIADPAIGAIPIYAILRMGSIGDLTEILRNTFNVSVMQQGRVLTLSHTRS
jgi:ferric-dicitrate binding protein FerR (iron transport regulator)